MIILLPPSEAKRPGGDQSEESVSVSFSKPLDIATSATDKELKCTGVRYHEGITLNRSVEEGPWMPAIERYDGVMYRALGYETMTPEGQQYIDDNVYILSGMYGILRPQDQIANYKLPISTCLKHYRKDIITNHINTIESTFIIDLLPQAYRSMIDRQSINAHVVSILWQTPDGKRLSHGVKSVKGRRLRHMCEDPTLFHDIEVESPSEVIYRVN